MKQIAKLKDEARKFEQREEWEKAIHAYAEVLRLGEGGDGADQDLPLYNRVGDLYVRLGRSAEAVKYYEQAADKYAETGLYNNAIALCNKALRYDAGRVELLKKLGQFSASQGFFTDARRWYLEYCERMSKRGAMDEAFLALGELADLHDNPEIRELLARQLRDHGRPEQAVEEFQRAYSLRMASGQTADANALRAEILALDPSADVSGTRRAGDVAHEAPSSHKNELPGFMDLDTPRRVAFDGPPQPSPMDSGIELDQPAPDYETPEPDTENTIDFDVPIASPDSPAADLLAMDRIDLDRIDLNFTTSLDFTPQTQQEPITDEFVPDVTEDEVVEDETAEQFIPEENFADADEAEELTGVTDGSFEMPEIERTNVDRGFGTFDVEDEVETLPELEGFEEPGFEEDADLPLMELEPEEPRFSFDDEEDAEPLPIFEPEEPPAAFEAEPEPQAEPDFERELPPLAEPDWVKETLPEIPAALAEPALSEPSFEIEPTYEEPEPEPVVFEPEPVAEVPRPAPPPPPVPVTPAPPPARVAASAPSAPPVPAAAPAARAKDDYIDLASFLSDEPEPSDSTRFVIAESAPTGDEEQDFADMLRQFKAKVAETIPKEDAGSHYDLGLAFKEMGLLDEAIAEFQTALRGGQEKLKVFEELGNCFVQKQQYSVAVTVLNRAMQMPHSDEADLLGVYYNLGRAHEELGQPVEARSAYERVISVDIGFQDTSARLAKL